MPRAIHIFGGGTVQHIRNHLAFCAPAYGTTARQIHALVAFEAERTRNLENEDCPLAHLHLTRMADCGSRLETNEDVEAAVSSLLANPTTAAIVFNVALCDYSGHIGMVKSGKYAPRLSTREGAVNMELSPTPKILAKIKEVRPDVFLVGFKTTADATPENQLSLARRQIRETQADLVLANDTVTRNNILVLAEADEIGSRDYLLKQIARHLLHA